MPKGKPTVFELPKSAKVSWLSGDSMILVKRAAKLARISPVIIEMGQRLLKRPGEEGGVFELASPDLVARADEIRRLFLTGLRRVATALGPGGLAAKGIRQNGKLVFWYEPAPGPKRRKG